MAELSVEKQEMITRIQRMMSEQDSGVMTVLTDSRHAVILRFSRGRLVRASCRGKGLAEIVKILADAQRVKYTFTAAEAENLPETVPTEDFLASISTATISSFLSNTDSQAFEETVLLPAREQSAATSPVNEAQVSAALLDVAPGFIGPMAEMLIESSMNAGGTVNEIVDRIALNIPNADESEDFRKAMGARLKSYKR